MRDVPVGTQIVVVGVCMEPDTTRPFFASAKELRLRYVFAYTPEEFARALRAISEGEVDIAPMITGTVDLDGTPGSLRCARAARDPSEDPGGAVWQRDPRRQSRSRLEEEVVGTLEEGAAVRPGRVLRIAAIALAWWVLSGHTAELAGASAYLTHIRWEWLLLAVGAELGSIVAYATRSAAAHRCREGPCSSWMVDRGHARQHRHHELASDGLDRRDDLHLSPVPP